jgi:hypothetical protein
VVTCEVYSNASIETIVFESRCYGVTASLCHGVTVLRCYDVTLRCLHYLLSEVLANSEDMYI